VRQFAGVRQAEARCDRVPEASEASAHVKGEALTPRALTAERPLRSAARLLDFANFLKTESAAQAPKRVGATQNAICDD
jgi:hypothetical protein